MKIAFVQQQNKGTLADNLQATEQEIATAANKGAQLVVLQELFATAYFCQCEDPQIFELAEPLNGTTCTALQQIAKTNDVVIVGSIFERRAAGLFHNTAIVFERDGSIAGVYRKMHIPDDPGYYEKYYFTPGDLGFKPIQTSVGVLGVLVCWDQWFPEAARLMALAGAQILIYPTAIGWDPTDTQELQQIQLDAWQTIQRGHAIANNLPCIAVNRTGFEADPSGHTEGIQFWGNSFVCAANGKVLLQAPHNEETTGIVDIDLTLTEEQRILWPFLRDRRIDHYTDLLKLQT